MAALPALILIQGNADFLSMDPEGASDPQMVSWVSVHSQKPACGSFKGASRVSVSFLLTEISGILSAFYSQNYWDLLFPVLDPQLRSPK